VEGPDVGHDEGALDEQAAEYEPEGPECDGVFELGCETRGLGEGFGGGLAGRAGESAFTGA
jgi:hypothetical protein